MVIFDFFKKEPIKKCIEINEDKYYKINSYVLSGSRSIIPVFLIFKTSIDIFNSKSIEIEVFNTKTNKKYYLNLEQRRPASLTSTRDDLTIDDAKEISKEEYISLLKNNICDCELFSGTNIKKSINPYSREEIYMKVKEKFKDSLYTIMTYPSINNTVRFKIFKKGVSLREVNINKDVSKKACLSCGKCLDEINDVYKQFESEIKTIEENEEQEQMIREICSQ